MPHLYRLLFIFLAAILFRLIPHWPNFTPMIAFSVYLSRNFTKCQALVVIFASAFLSDFLLSQRFGYSVVGMWSLFTYSAYALIILVFRGEDLIQNACLGSLVFWVWTNFGTWLMSGMYPHNPASFCVCYLMALPFLGNALLGALFWSFVLRMVRSPCENFINLIKMY